MALDTRFERVTFPSGTGRRTVNGSSILKGRVLNGEAAVVLNGFKVDYSNSDHHVDILEIDVDHTGTNGSTVTWRVEVNYRDRNADDRYSAEVQFVVIADVAA